MFPERQNILKMKPPLLWAFRSLANCEALVRTHVINEDLEAEIPIQSFRATDLLLLKMLSAPHSAVMSQEIV